MGKLIRIETGSVVYHLQENVYSHKLLVSVLPETVAFVDRHKLGAENKARPYGKSLRNLVGEIKKKIIPSIILITS